MKGKEVPQVEMNILSLLLQVRKDPVSLLSKLHREYGDIFSLKAGSFNIMVFSNPNYVKHILMENSNNYTGRMGITQVIKGKVVTEGISSDHNPQGIELKEFTGHLLTKTAAEKLTPDIVSLTKQKIEQWKETQEPEFVLNIYREFVYLSVEIVGLTLFGVDISDVAVELSDTAKQLLRLIHQRYLKILRLPMWVPTPANLKQKRLAEQLYDIFDQVLDQSLNLGREDNILKTWMKIQKKHEEFQHFGSFERQQDMMSFFIPSFETTPFVITTTLYQLARFPQVQEEIRKEIQDVFGEEDPDYTKFSKLDTLKAFVSEVMRYYPPLWALFKRAKENDQIEGIEIPHKTLVVVSQQLMHHHEAHWDDPNEFKPYRFKDLEEEGSIINPWIYFPFGRGTFTCIAQNFAWAEIYSVISLVLQNFTVSLVEQDAFPFEALATVLVPVEPIKLRFTKK